MMRTLFLTFVALPALLLAACGLTPVYGTRADESTGAGISTALNDIYIDSIPDRTGQKLRNILIDRMVSDGANAKADARYRLTVSTPEESIYGIGISKDATATRSQLKLNAEIRVYDSQSKDTKPVLTRALWAVTSFNQLGSQYTTLVTEEDARNQAIRQLSDQIVTQLELYFFRQ